jgi:two-component system, OmpR family, response regulator
MPPEWFYRRLGLSAMVPVLISGVERPGLAGLLAHRGMTAVAAGAAAVALVPCLSLVPALPSVVEAADALSAAALLDAGAADVVLAGDPDTLVAARLAAIARRRTSLRIGDIHIDPVDRRVTRAGIPVPLLPREYALLLLLVRAAGEPRTRDELRQGLSGLACSPDSNMVAVHVSRLRAKLGPGRAAVVTHKGRGYALVADREAAG